MATPRYAQTRFDTDATHPLDETARIARAAVQAERKRRAHRADLIAGWTINIISFFLSGWLFMLAVGIARANWLPDLPTIGYSTTLLLLGVVAGAIIAYMGGREAVRSNRRGRS